MKKLSLGAATGIGVGVGVAVSVALDDYCTFKRKSLGMFCE